MSKVLSSLFIFFVIVSLTSCTSDSSMIIGVWEQEGFMENSGQRLVFASDHTGLKIFRNKEGELVTSSVSECLWEKASNVVTLYNAENNVIIGTYSLNSEGQLVLDNMNELPFDKISETTLKYY